MDRRDRHAAPPYGIQARSNAHATTNAHAITEEDAMMKRHTRFLAGAMGATLTALSALSALVGFPPSTGTAVGMTPAPSLRFETLARVGLPLSGLVWTGSRFVYTVEGRPQLYASTPDGKNLRPFARVPRNGGEMRCVASPGDHGWPTHALYCHAADGPIYRIASGGGAVARFATVPSPQSSDGALAFDTVGRFGYALLAATGGSDSGPGGDVYAITPEGNTRHVGHYGGPGGAENLAIAPAGFGSAAGQALICVDQHDHHGRLLAMDVHGAVRTLVRGLPWGLNPVVSLVATAPAGGTSGLYIADWLSRSLLFAPGDQLHAYRGDVFVGAERRGYMYVVRPNGTGYTVLPIRTNLHAHDYNMEGVAFLAS